MTKCYFGSNDVTDPWDAAYHRGKTARGHGEALNPAELVFYLQHRRHMVTMGAHRETRRRRRDALRGAERVLREVIACVNVRENEGRGAWPGEWKDAADPGMPGCIQYTRAYPDKSAAAWVLACTCGCERATKTVFGRKGHRLSWEVFRNNGGPKRTPEWQANAIMRGIDNDLHDLCAGEDPHKSPQR